MDLRLARGIPEISVDRPQMESAVKTLVRKALNQMPEGTTLSISTSRENDMFKLAMQYPVQDILPDDVEQFFYPFIASRMGHDTTDLPRVEILVHKHGGLIDVGLESGELVIQISLPLLPSFSEHPLD